MSEEFVIDAPSELAYLRNSGLLWYVNTMLHPFGLAIAVNTNEGGAYEGISLVSTPDPAGIVFDDPQREEGRRKFIDWFVVQE